MIAKVRLWILVLLLFSSVSFALPPQLGIAFKGTVVDMYGNAFPDGTKVAVWVDGVKMHEVETILGKGYYHHLKLQWDDPDTRMKEGVVFAEGVEEEIIFTVDDVPVHTMKISSEHSGKILLVDLQKTFTKQPTLAMPGPVYNFMPLLVVLLLSIAIIILWRRRKR